MFQDYKTWFQKLNDADNEVLSDENNKKLESFCKSIGFKDQVPQLDHSTISELLWIQLFYSKPVSAERCITLRNKMLRHLEKANPEQAKLLENVVRYYGCLGFER